MTASFWAAGSFGTVAWAQLWPALVALAVCAVLVLGAARPLRQLELGDDHAAAHGLRVERARLGIVVLGVALTAIPTAVAGPIAFIALATLLLVNTLFTNPRASALGLSTTALGALIYWIFYKK